jgi:AraC-like DNA-binding protein
VDEVRFEVARHLLETTDLSVVHIAGALSYADASAFTRAFRRWSRTTPAQWRQARAAGSTTPGG